MIFYLFSGNALLINQYKAFIGKDEHIADKLVGLFNSLGGGQYIGKFLLNFGDINFSEALPIKPLNKPIQISPLHWFMIIKFLGHVNYSFVLQIKIFIPIPPCECHRRLLWQGCSN